MKLCYWLRCLLLAMAASGCATIRDPALQTNRRVVQQYFERWANRGDPTVADALIVPELRLTNPPTVLKNREDYKSSMARFRSAFPDLSFTVEDMICEADKVAVRWTMRGTHKGEMAGRAPTGRSMTVTGVSVFRLSGGKICEIHVHMDRMGQMEQLGWAPAPAAGQRK